MKSSVCYILTAWSIWTLFPCPRPRLLRFHGVQFVGVAKHPVGRSLNVVTLGMTGARGERVGSDWKTIFLHSPSPSELSMHDLSWTLATSLWQPHLRLRQHWSMVRWVEVEWMELRNLTVSRGLQGITEDYSNTKWFTEDYWNMQTDMKFKGVCKDEYAKDYRSILTGIAHVLQHPVHCRLYTWEVNKILSRISAICKGILKRWVRRSILKCWGHEKMVLDLLYRSSCVSIIEYCEYQLQEASRLPWLPRFFVWKTAFLQPSTSNPMDTSCITIPSSISTATGSGSVGGASPSGSSSSSGCRPRPLNEVMSSSSGMPTISTSEDWE